MIIEIPNENSIVKWKNDEKDEWKVAEISDLIKAYEKPCGRWIKKVDDVGFVSYICSECGAEIDVEDCSDDKFCFNCGIYMRGYAECMDEDAKQASIPYTYNAPQHDWKCGYPDITRDKGGTEV